jgi:hypothetical protein
MTGLDLLLSLTETLPAGLYDNLSIERYVRRVLESSGQSNDFRDLDRDLYLIATNLDSGERVVFCRDAQHPVPISLAVAASSALPVLYKPVRILGHEYVDGGLRGNASIDVAIEQGATLVVCINPIVPFDNSDLKTIPFVDAQGGYLSEKGFTTIASQVGRINSHAGLHYHVKQLRKTHPEVDIILIEPSRADQKMFFYNIMRYSAQLDVARHGFETVTVQLAENYAFMKELLGRHNVAISRRLVLEELEQIRRSKYHPGTIRRVLEAGAAGYRSPGRNRPVSRLHRTLSDLDQALGRLGPAR